MISSWEIFLPLNFEFSEEQELFRRTVREGDPRCNDWGWDDINKIVVAQELLGREFLPYR